MSRLIFDFNVCIDDIFGISLIEEELNLFFGFLISVPSEHMRRRRMNWAYMEWSFCMR